MFNPGRRAPAYIPYYIYSLRLPIKKRKDNNYEDNEDYRHDDYRHDIHRHHNNVRQDKRHCQHLKP